MRNFIQMVEGRRLAEIRIGGEVDSTGLDDLAAEHDFTPKQLTLLPKVPSEPTLPPKMEMRGRLGPYYVTSRKETPRGGGADETTYYLFDSGKPVAYVATLPPESEFGDGYPGRKHSDPELHGDGLRVISIFVDPEARGQKVSVALYAWLLRNECDYILPDDLQTPGGVYIWKQLLGDPKFDVMIFNPDKHETYRAKPGAVWANVYRSHRLRPFVTLAGKAADLIDD